MASFTFKGRGRADRTRTRAYLKAEGSLQKCRVEHDGPKVQPWWVSVQAYRAI